MKQKAVRYVVHHIHDWHGYQEEAWASYSTALDRALDYATHTASRYHGEIFTDNGDGILQPFKSYMRQAKV